MQMKTKAVAASQVFPECTNVCEYKAKQNSCKINHLFQNLDSSGHTECGKHNKLQQKVSSLVLHFCLFVCGFVFLMLAVQFRAPSLTFQVSGRPSEIPVNFKHLRPHVATVVSQNWCESHFHTSSSISNSQTYKSCIILLKTGTHKILQLLCILERQKTGRLRWATNLYFLKCFTLNMNLILILFFEQQWGCGKIEDCFLTLPNDI